MGHYFTHKVSFVAYHFIFFIIMLIQFAFYLFLAKKEIKHYEVKIKDTFSSIEKISLSWLNSFANVALAFCIFLLVFCAFLFIFVIILGPFKNQFSISIRLFPNIVSLLLIVIVFKALRQPLILSDFSEDRKYETPLEKYELSNLIPKDAEKYLQKLIRYMEEEKPYLQPELALKQIADKLQIPVRHLSQVINEKIGMNFYNYINSYRIEEIKKYLSDPDFKKETILNLAYDAGFNSKSTFNAVFKKATGLTPQQYRRTAFN